MELTHELRENAGLQWVLERLSPLSPFGKQAARTPRWYGPGEEAALEEELDNVALAMELWAAGGTAPQAAEGCGCEAPRVNPADLKDAAAALRGVTRCLPLFHDIRGSFDREPGTPFDLVELFEIKHFLVTMEQVTDAYAKMPALAGIAFPPLTEAMALMDPEGRRLPTFSIVNSYHNDLAPLRVEKAKLEKAIRMTQEDKRGPLLEKRRVLAVQEDQLELEVRRMLTEKLMVYKPEFLANMEALGHLDLIVAKGKLALRYHCVRPPSAPINPSPCVKSFTPRWRRIWRSGGSSSPRWIWNCAPDAPSSPEPTWAARRCPCAPPCSPCFCASAASSYSPSPPPCPCSTGWTSFWPTAARGPAACPPSARRSTCWTPCCARPGTAFSSWPWTSSPGAPTPRRARPWPERWCGIWAPWTVWPS